MATGVTILRVVVDLILLAADPAVSLGQQTDLVSCLAEAP